MKKSTLTTLVAAIAMGNVCTAMAVHKYTGQPDNAPLHTPAFSYVHNAPVDAMHFQGPMWDAPNWDGLLEGSHMSLWLRAAYFNLDYKHAKKSIGATGTSRPDWKQAGVGGMLDWLSGYAGGWFGINAALYGAQKLDATGPGPSNGFISARNSLDANDNPRYKNNYGRLGRLNAKFRFGDETNNVLAHVGYVGADSEYLESTLLAPEPHKITLSTERGATFKSNLENLKLYGAYWDRFNERTSSSLNDRFTNGAGKNIDYVYGGGATYTIPFGGDTDNDHKLALNAEYAEGKNYLREYLGQATYRYPFNENTNMVANGQYYYVKKAGNLWDNSGLNGSNLFDKDAHLANVNLTFNIHRVTFGGAITHSRAKSTNGRGITSNHFYYSPAGNYAPGGYFGTSRQDSDFDFDGETAYQLSAGYDFSDFIEGLSASVTHTHGNNINKKVGLKNEIETDLAILYKVPAIQGLWFDLEEAYYHSTSKNNSYASNQGQRFNDFRIWANYQVATF